MKKFFNEKVFPLVMFAAVYLGGAVIGLIGIIILYGFVRVIFGF
jgi:hypothetical protein